MKQVSSSTFLRRIFESNQQGVVIPIVAGSIVAIFAIIGLALDSGNIYRARMWTQKAADAAALSAAAVLAINGDGAVGQAQNAGTRLARANLDALPIGYDVGNINVSYSAANSKVTVTVETTIGLFLLHLVPGVGTSRRIESVAVAEVMPAIVAVMVEASTLMDCPETTLNCAACTPACGNERFDSIEDGLERFVEAFDETRDFLSLTTFRNHAGLRFPMPYPGRPDGGFDAPTVDDFIDRMGGGDMLADTILKGQSNLCDAVQRAYINTRQLVQARNLPPGTETFFVLLTAGAPNAVRMQYANPATLVPAPNLPSNPNLPYSPYDYVYFTKENAAGDPVPTQLSFGRPADANNTVSSLGSSPPAACSGDAFTGSATEPFTGALPPETPTGACLNDWSFHTWSPTMGSRIHLGGNSDFTQWAQRIYDCPLAWVESSRDEDAVWYVVGTGPACLPTSPDPYQGVGDSSVDPQCRHDTLLKRIAFVREYIDPLDNQLPDFPYIPTWQERKDQRRAHGEVLLLDAPTNIRRRMLYLHERIARRQKIRLVSQ